MNKPASSSFSYSALWDDTVRMLRANSTVLIALAGAFIFLPNLVSTYFIPLPAMATASEIGPKVQEYLASNWHWQLIIRLINAVGAISIFLIIFGRGASTVGDAISASFRLLPFYFLAVILTDIILFLGFIAFIIPALYLFGRLSVIGPVVVAERRTNPIDAVRRSFELTRGRGWAAFGLIAIIFIVGMLLSLVASMVIGTVMILVAGKALGAFLLLILSSIAAAAVSTVLIILYAAFYRRLTGAAHASVPASNGI